MWIQELRQTNEMMIMNISSISMLYAITLYVVNPWS